MHPLQHFYSLESFQIAAALVFCAAVVAAVGSKTPLNIQRFVVGAAVVLGVVGNVIILVDTGRDAFTFWHGSIAGLIGLVITTILVTVVVDACTFALPCVFAGAILDEILPDPR